MSKKYKIVQLKICDYITKFCNKADKYVAKQKLTFEEENELGLFVVNILKLAIKNFEDQIEKGE